MKKKTYQSFLLALGVLASVTSCSESESLHQSNLSNDRISFLTTLNNSWQSMTPGSNSSSRAALDAANGKGPIHVPTPFGKPLYLHPVVQETADLQQTAATTRGAMQEGTTLDNTYYNNSFGVTAIYEEDGAKKALFANQKAKKNNNVWELEDPTNSRWPYNTLVSFHAFAPYNNSADGMWNITTDVENVKTKISYTAKADAITSQPDLIVATNAESRSYTSEDKAVELNFSHALTAVNFAISQDLTEIFHTGAADGSKLKSITLSGIPNEGTCELAAKDGSPKTALQNWTLATDANGKKTGSYTFNLENKNITIGESCALTSNEDKNILMMIPQNLQGTNAQLTFVLDIKGKGDQTYTFDLSNQNWLPGTSVTYKLSASAINHLENAEVKFPDSWNGVNYPKTGFAEGESIGLYVVNSNNAIEGENLECVKQVDGSWKIGDGNTKYLKLKGYKYFAYYPYHATAPAVDATKDHANEFFKDKITNWSPVENQKTEDALLSQDLQVGEGVIDNDASTLTFNMAHSMGLAVLNLENKDIPKTRRFVNNSYSYYYPSYEHRVTTEPTKGKDYTDDNTKQTVRASAAFSGNIPCSSKITAFRYLQIVKPSTNVSFKASDESRKPRSAWGTHTSYTFNVAQNAAETKSITTDADFYYLARLYTCTQSVANFTTPVAGDYKIECWGAQGSNMLDKVGGKGGYCKGTVNLSNRTIYIYVGAQSGGFGGGGVTIESERNNYFGNDGGGATDIRLVQGNTYKDFNSLKSRIIVAAGGGGANHRTKEGEDPRWGQGDGGYGGGLNGGNGKRDDTAISWNSPNLPYVVLTYGATQKTGGYQSYSYKKNGQFGDYNIKTDTRGKFGYSFSAPESFVQSGGGGGYYAGCAGGHVGASGGSSFISGYSGCDAISESSTEQAIVHTGQPNHYSGLVFTDTQMIDGANVMPSPNGGTEIGHSGDGACIISWFLK